MKNLKKQVEKAKNAVEKQLNVDLDGDGVVGKKKKNKNKQDPYYPNYYQQQQQPHYQPSQFPQAQNQHPETNFPSAPPPDDAPPRPYQPPTQNQQKLMEITIPSNTFPGQQLQIRSPEGQLFAITVPQNCAPGQKLRVQVPSTSQQTPSQILRPQHTHQAPQHHHGNVPQNPQMTNFPNWYNFYPQSYRPVGIGLHDPRSSSTFRGSTTRKKALLIGINYLGQKAQLRGCVNDVARMREFLITKNGFRDSPESMVILTDEDLPGRRSDGQPTKANMIKAIQWLVAGVQSGDALFYHFSGHGASQKDPSGQEKDGYNETICPVDFQQNGMIVDDQLWDLMVYPLQSGVKLTAICDACHSGTGLDLPYRFKYKPGKGKWKTEVNPSLCEADVVLLSGCNDDETSLDSSAKVKDAYGRTSKIASGAMTSAFLAAANDVQLGYNRNISYYQFLERLYQHLRPFTAGGPQFFNPAQQNPQMTCSQSFDIHQRNFCLDIVNTHDVIPNGNAKVGRIVRHHYKPKVNLANTGLGEMLMVGAGAVLLGNVAGETIGALADGIGALGDFF
eukprot:augustus_masked-scaffold_4-processed-gene-3.57-mRNA-1 protein AED:0.14 eAED:0.16 QI:0/-1/0/1/-1/1/1/0/560